MENRGDADAGAEVFWVGRDGDQSLGRSLEQQIINDSLVLVGDVGDGRRQCEHDMIIRHGQQVGLARRQPVLCRRALALRTVPVAAGVIRDLAVGAVLATRDMPAERRRAAVLDRRHHLELAEADMAGFGPGAMPDRCRGRYPRPPAMDATRAPRFRRAVRRPP